MPQLYSRYLAGIIILVSVWTQAQADDSKLEGHEIHMDDVSIVVSFAPGDLSLSQKELLTWISQSARHVSQYYRQFPIDHLMLLVQPVAGKEVMSGTAYGGEVPYLVVRVGHEADQTSIGKDWILIHEMVHLALPQMNRRHHWLEEGIATYIEPVLRHQSGLVDEHYVWDWLYAGLPNGLPPNNEGGLDGNMTWGNIYWGGTMFCFLADLRIREATKGRKGLKDALIAIVEKGGSIKQDWSIEKVLSLGDQATNTSVMSDLYAMMSKDFSRINLNQIWYELGIEKRGSAIKLLDAAPKVWLRHALINH